LDKPAVVKMLKAFDAKGVSQEMIEKKIGRRLAQGFTEDNRVTMAGIWNAISDEGGSTVAEMFPEEAPDEPAPKPTADPGTQPKAETKPAGGTGGEPGTADSEPDAGPSSIAGLDPNDWKPSEWAQLAEQYERVARTTSLDKLQSIRSGVSGRSKVGKQVRDWVDARSTELRGPEEGEPEPGPSTPDSEPTDDEPAADDEPAQPGFNW
jgi:hypothetical protein